MARSCLLLCLLLVSISGGVLSCQPPDCDHQDCGTCANACCLMEFMFQSSPSTVNRAIVDLLNKKGPDGRYNLVADIDFRNLQLSSGVKWQLQATHTTLVNRYVDTLDFLISSVAPDLTSVRAFSISRIAGAYCDEGQNYKNIVGFMKGLGIQFNQTIILGCPADLKTNSNPNSSN